MKDKSYGNTTNSTDIKAFSRFDLIISSQVTENLQFHFVVRNLLNRKNYIPGAWGTDYGFRDETLNGSVQLEYTF
jgi:outer membrane receptor protein involved in Fe transport